MMKYFVVLCLCLTVGVVLAQDQETTTEKRVARDVPDMSNFPQAGMQMMKDGMEQAAEAAKGFMDTMQSIPQQFSSGIPTSRRRRSQQDNQKPPLPPKPQ